MKNPEIKLSLSERITVALRGRLSLTKIIRGFAKPSSEGAYLASYMTPDKLHSILRSAEMGECSALFDLYRDIIAADSHIQAEFAKRKTAVICELITAQPNDEKNPEDVRIAELVQDMLDSIPDRVHIIAHMMDSCLYPLSIVEKVFKPSSTPGLHYDLRGLYPVEHRLIDLREGDVRIYDTNEEGRIQQTSILADQNSFIIHRNHILSHKDNWGGPMRSLLFWWLFSAMNITWWVNWLERYGLPFLVGKYSLGDDESRMVLEQAFNWATKLGGLVVTSETQIEVINALQSQNGDAYDRFIKICQREKSKLILGQTLSAEAQPTGMNSGTSNAHEAVRGDIRLLDCVMVATTLRDSLVIPFMRANGLKSKAPKIVIGGEAEEDLNALTAVIAALKNAGIRLTDEGIAVLAQRLNIGLERDTSALVPGLASFSADLPADEDAISANEEIARQGAAAIAQKQGQMLALIQKALAKSTSQQDFEREVEKICKGMDSVEINMIIQDAIRANLLNGVSKK